MKLNICIKSLGDYPQYEFVQKYYSALKALIFDLLKSTKFDCDNDDIKCFSFSNLYPVKNQKINENQHYFINISSCYEELLDTIVNNIPNIINLGIGQFEVKEIKKCKEKIYKNSILKTKTPVIITRSYGDKKYLNINEDRERYLKNLRLNSIKKYNVVFGENIDYDYELFNDIIIYSNYRNNYVIKITDNKDINSQKSLYFYGNILVLEIGDINDTQKNILELCLNIGLGNKNSYGMGYIDY